MKSYYDFVVMGGGIIGLSIARALKITHPTSAIALLEKEAEIGLHASGRSGGMIQPGFFHSGDPEKIRITYSGNLKLTKFCEDHHITLNKCGQFIIAQKEADIEGLRVLQKRAKMGNIPIEWLTEEQTHRIDPNVKTYGASLYTPIASTMVPMDVCFALCKENRERGIDVLMNTRYLSRIDDGIMTNRGRLTYKKLFSATGCHSDEVAHDFGFALDYKIIPFTIAFMKSLHPTEEVKTNIFSVANFDFPYVEVKQSPMTDRKLKIGPVVTSALGRESHLGISRVTIGELMCNLLSDLKLGLLYRYDKVNYVKLGISEYRKKFIHYMKMDANRQLTTSLSAKFGWDKTGVIANLFNTKSRKYVDDLLVFNDDKACHLVNTIFPGFTTAIPIAELIVNKYSV